MSRVVCMCLPMEITLLGMQKNRIMACTSTAKTNINMKGTGSVASLMEKANNKLPVEFTKDTSKMGKKMGEEDLFLQEKNK